MSEEDTITNEDLRHQIAVLADDVGDLECQLSLLDSRLGEIHSLLLQLLPARNAAA